MYGFACDETPEYMPYAIAIAHKLAQKLTEARKNGEMPYLKSDGKVQVTVEYVNYLPLRIDAILVSAQHNENVDMPTLRKDILEKVILEVVEADMVDVNTKLYINPTGRFVIGGAVADTGLNGRKIIADTYGGYAKHGGGAFSGKDGTKVDRTAKSIEKPNIWDIWDVYLLKERKTVEQKTIQQNLVREVKRRREYLEQKRNIEEDM